MESSEEDKEVDRQLGAWLRAFPRRGRQEIERRQVFLKGAHSIDFGMLEVDPKGIVK